MAYLTNENFVIKEGTRNDLKEGDKPITIHKNVDLISSISTVQINNVLQGQEILPGLPLPPPLQQARKHLCEHQVLLFARLYLGRVILLVARNSPSLILCVL